MRRLADTTVAGRSDDQAAVMESLGYETGTVSFHWKVSSQAYSDFVLFYIDGSLKDAISGDVDWTQKQYTVNTEGAHIFRWEYVKDSSGSDGYDRAWVDYLQWTGDSEPPAPESSGGGGQTVTYTYDPAGRRIAKSIDGTVAVKYVYDGPQCIAEYDVNDALLRTFIYGPGIDQPICMIEAGGTYSGAYYYHFDGLGSVIALSDDDGDTVVTYEYDAFGLPASSDPNHPNPFLFTGRRYDPETGLYHYRARAYNPYIGRFLQLDPVREGMNWYMYCLNNSVNLTDSTGKATEKFPTTRATGRIVVQSSTGYVPFLSETIGCGAGVLVDLGRLVSLAPSVYQGVSAQILGVLATINATLTTSWHWDVYIELADYCDWNENGVMDEEDKRNGDYTLVEKYWRKLTGAVHPDDSEGGHYTEGSGYDYDAPDAALRAATAMVAKLGDFGGEIGEGDYIDLPYVNGAMDMDTKYYMVSAFWKKMFYGLTDFGRSQIDEIVAEITDEDGADE